MQVDGLIQKVGELGIEDRLNLAKNTYADLMHRLAEEYGDEKAVTLFVTFVKVFVSADKLTSEAEYELFKLITGADWDYQTFFEITNGGSDPELVEQVNDFIDNLDEDGKVAAVVMALCFITIDGEVTDSERFLLQKLYD